MKKLPAAVSFPDNFKAPIADAHNSLSLQSSTTCISPKIAVFLLLLTLMFFANTIHQYFLLDDFEVLYSAKYNSLSQVLLGHDTVLEGKFFRPIPMFFTWLLYKIFGSTPSAYHVLSLLLHAGVAIAAANLIYLIHQNVALAALTGALFVIFPNHAEVVNWPAITFTSWAALFYLLSLNSFAYFRLLNRKYLLALSLVLFLAGMLSKEEAVTLPGVLILFDFFFSKMRRLKIPFLRQTPIYLPYFLLLLIVLFITRIYMKMGAGYLTVEGEDLVSLYLNNIYTLGSDLIKMNLRLWRNLLTPISPEIPYAGHLSPIALLLSLISLVLLLWKRKIPLLAVIFAFLFVSITALPILGTFRVLALTHWIRFLYLPSAGACYILGLVLYNVQSYWTRSAAKFALLAAVFLPLMALAKYYDHQWIAAQRENHEVMTQVREKLDKLPPYSRIYAYGIPWSQNEIPRIDYAFPAAANLYYDRDRLQAALYFLPANKPLALEREIFDDRPWTYFKTSWDPKAGKMTVPVDMTPKTPDEAPAPVQWDFAKAEHARFVNSMFPLKKEGFSYPLFVTQGSWTLLWLPPNNPDAPVKYASFEIMIAAKKSGIDISRLFWTTEDDPVISGGKSIGFFVKTDGNFHSYKIPLYRNGLTLIHPRILRFALRPSQREGAIFSIRNFSIEYY